MDTQTSMRDEARAMIREIIADNLPHKGVEDALRGHEWRGNIYLAAIGKAAWAMADTAARLLGDRLVRGALITKYGHAADSIPRVEIYEAGHPVPDENTLRGTEALLELSGGLRAGDELLFLVSGGGSALFEKPKDGVMLADLADITRQLLACGADIAEVNTIRKRLSLVKAGRFAQACGAAKVFAVLLSDVLGDAPSVIASGPAAPDPATAAEARAIAERYALRLTPRQRACLEEETPKRLDNVETVVTGSVRTLCEAAARAARARGYAPHILTDALDCEAASAGAFLGAVAAAAADGRGAFATPCALIAGGETVVRVSGSGLGGRNQELALAAAEKIAGYANALIFSLGSDGTDGPTDAAGGMVDGNTAERLSAAGGSIHAALAANDSYRALKAADGLIMTGPTGTNVNDVAVALCRGAFPRTL